MWDHWGHRCGTAPRKWSHFGAGITILTLSRPSAPRNGQGSVRSGVGGAWAPPPDPTVPPGSPREVFCI